MIALRDLSFVFMNGPHEFVRSIYRRLPCFQAQTDGYVRLLLRRCSTCFRSTLRQEHLDP
jgi:hypothetical protein